MRAPKILFPDPKGEAFYKELEQTWNELSNGVNSLASKNGQPYGQ